MHQLLVTGILGAFTAFAEPSPAPAAAGQGPHREHAGLCKKLECTDAQREAVLKIKQEQRAEAEAAKKEIDAVRAKLAAEFKKDSLNEAAIDKLQDQINDLHADLANGRLDGMKAIHALLTPAQRTKLAEKVAKGRFGHHGGKKGWHGKRGGKNRRGAKSPTAG